jgi:hypothetical protein
MATDNSEKSFIKSKGKKKFSQVYNLPIAKIVVKPEIFQGRSVPFAKETVEKIVKEGYDTSQEPIALYKHGKFGNIVISGHSRYEAAKRLSKNPKNALKTIPIKFFLGDFDDAVDYAVIESNRSGKAEGIESDIKAYLRAKERGYNKEFLMSIFKSDSYISQLRDLAVLNPQGDFIKNLSQTSERSFPYLLRNAIWAGSLKRIYPELTKSHEKEIFDFFYGSGKKGLTVTKDSFFKKIKGVVEAATFNPSKSSLRLNNEKEFDRISERDPGFIKFRQIQSAIEQFNSERTRKEQKLVYAQQEGNPIAKNLDKEVSDLTLLIRMKYIDLKRLQIQLNKEDTRLKTTGLFD